MYTILYVYVYKYIYVYKCVYIYIYTHIYIYYIYFGCIGSSLLHTGFLQLQQPRAAYS